MKGRSTLSITAFIMITCSVSAAAEPGDPQRGQRVFRSCAACHSLEPGRHMTGPSLAELWNRKSGSLLDFRRYSPALKSSDVIWNDTTLNDWLRDPRHVIPGNTMIFPGIKDEQHRADLLAYLKQASQPNASTAESPSQGPMGGMMSGMGGARTPNLRKLDADEQVNAISYCGDSYKVTTADGGVRDFWERNLRFKTDSSDDGPVRDAPAIIGAGMMGESRIRHLRRTGGDQSLHQQAVLGRRLADNLVLKRA